VRSFRGADCDTDYYLVVTKLRERISVSKRASQKFDLERFDLKKLDDVEVKEKYQVEIPNRLTTLESLDESFEINNSWESIKENIKHSAKDNLGYQKLKHNKPWFDDECLDLIDQRKQAKLQWLQNISQISGDNLQNLRRKTSGTLRDKKREYLRKEHRLRVFENRVLRIFGPKREEDGSRRKLHNDELHSLYSSLNIVRVIKLRLS
jgi:hypothetical protein